MDLRLASYNVHCFPWVPTSIEDIVELICRNCDVVALQEVWCRHTAWADIFAEHGWTFVAPAREHHIASLLGSGLAFAYSPKWRCTDSRFYPFLASGGLDFLAAKGWFRMELVRITDGFPVRIVNTHMQADYEIWDELWHPVTQGIRMAQSLQMIEVERRLPLLPTLIVGDLNTEECLVPGGCFLRKCKSATFPLTGQVLDHCVDVAFGPAGWRLMEHSVLPSPLSDHWPVLWSFLWGME
jgi:hypothetical protein